MIKIIETTTEQREQEFHQKYNEFRNYYENTELLMSEIWRKVGLTPTCSTGKRIREQLRHDGHDPLRRGQKLKRASEHLEVLIEVRNELRNGESIDETLRKHNLTLKDAVRNMEKSNTKPMQKVPLSVNIDSKHIYKVGNYYVVQKSVRGRSYNFGTYNCLADAERVRDYFVEHGWRKSDLNKACRVVGVERRVR